MAILWVKNGREKNCMNDRIFIDSNILVYSIDDNEPKKQSVANKIIWQLAEDGGTISTQVL